MKIVQIDIDPTRVGKIVNVDAGVVGDAKLTLKKLFEQDRPDIVDILVDPEKKLPPSTKKEPGLNKRI